MIRSSSQAHVRNWTDFGISRSTNKSLRASPKIEKMNVIITKNKVKSDLISYLHACCFSPNISTFIKAVKNGNFITWPGLTTSAISKHLHPSIATAKGHLD